MTSPSKASLVLIATASILIDRTTNHYVIFDRLKCQILLWLILAISQNDLTDAPTTAAAAEQWVFHTWLNVIFFGNIVSIVSDDGMERNTDFPLRIPKQHLHLDLLSLSSWVSLVAFTIRSGTSSWHDNHHDSVLWTVKVFMISLGIFWALKWYWRRKATIAQDAPFVPGIFPASQTLRFTQQPGIGIELSRWYDWNVKQTWTWISAVMGTNTNTNDAQTVLRLLEPHLLQGNVLDTLTVQCLVQMMKIPYGPAMHLCKEIDSLKKTYPKPNSAGGGFEMSSISSFNRQGDWLTKHDQEYNTWTYPAISLDDSEFGVSGVRSNPIPPIDPKEEERLSQIMKDRYGLHLPTVQLSSMPSLVDNISTSAGVTHSEPIRPTNDRSQAYGGKATLLPTNPPSQNHTIQHAQSVHVSGCNDKHGDSTLDFLSSTPLPVSSSLLDQMPPAIREIAERRPDLVHRFLSQKASPLPSTSVRNAGETTSELLAKDLLGDEEGGASDDEMASLIQQK